VKIEERVELATYVGKNHVTLACDIESSFNTPHDRNHIVKKPPIILSFQIKHAYIGKNHVILAKSHSKKKTPHNPFFADKTCLTRCIYGEKPCDIDDRNHIVKKPPIILKTCLTR
jgi:hypothetical protein